MIISFFCKVFVDSDITDNMSSGFDLPQRFVLSAKFGKKDQHLFNRNHLKDKYCNAIEKLQRFAVQIDAI